VVRARGLPSWRERRCDLGRSAPSAAASRRAGSGRCSPLRTATGGSWARLGAAREAVSPWRGGACGPEGGGGLAGGGGGPEGDCGMPGGGGGALGSLRGLGRRRRRAVRWWSRGGALRRGRTLRPNRALGPGRTLRLARVARLPRRPPMVALGRLGAHGLADARLGTHDSSRGGHVIGRNITAGGTGSNPTSRPRACFGKQGKVVRSWIRSATRALLPARSAPPGAGSGGRAREPPAGRWWPW
jgi:hypothetical protein